MSKTRKTNYRRGIRGTRKAERHIVVRSERRDPPDLQKLARAVIAMARREAEAEAKSEADAEVRDAMNGSVATDADVKDAA